MFIVDSTLHESCRNAHSKYAEYVKNKKNGRTTTEEATEKGKVYEKQVHEIKVFVNSRNRG